MVKRQLVLIDAENNKQPTQAFTQNLQAALLLSLLDKHLLTGWQFDQCIETLQNVDAGAMVDIK